MRGRMALCGAALVVSALWLCPAPVCGRAMLLPLPRDAARFAAAAAAAEADYDAVAGAGVNWPDDDPLPPGLSQEEQTRLLRMLLLRMVQEHEQRDHGHGHERDRGQGERDAAIDAALAAAGPLLEPPEPAGDDDVDDPLPYTDPHAPDDKRNLQGMMPMLCHFKICHMARKRNQQMAVARAAH